MDTETEQSSNFDECSDYQGNLLRPQHISEYIGQEKLKERVAISIDASKKLDNSVSHMLFYGPPGLGKTTISSLIAKTRGVGFKSMAAPSIKVAGDLVSVLVTLQKNDVLFIDEIHRLPTFVEEMLYSAMEDFFITIPGNENNGGEPIKLTLDPFTLIGATTRPGMISNPLKDRFGIQAKLEYYTVEELSIIIKHAANKIGFDITPTSCEIVSKRSRGTPRIALRLMRLLYDYHLSKNMDLDNEDEVNNVLTIMSNVDEGGMTEAEIRYMTLLHTHGKLGLKSLASMLSEDEQYIVDSFEPYLMQNEFVMITSRGRELTEKGTQYILSK